MSTARCTSRCWRPSTTQVPYTHRHRDHQNADTEILPDSDTRLGFRYEGPESATEHDSGTYPFTRKERGNCCTRMCIGSKAVLYFRRMDFGITQLSARELFSRRRRRRLLLEQALGVQVNACNMLWFQDSGSWCRVDLIFVSMYDRYSGSIKLTAHLDQSSRCKETPGTNYQIDRRTMYVS